MLQNLFSGSSFRNILLSNLTGKITLITIFLLFPLIYNSYSACIFSMLISSEEELPFHDIEGMMNYGEYDIKFHKTSSLLNTLKAST